MTGRERRSGLAVGSLFATLFRVFGSGYTTAGVFFTPLLDHFGWTRAQLSLLQTTLALSAGLVVPLVGWLLDRLEARVVIVAGAAATGIGFLLASRADAVVPMVRAYAPVRPGLRAATLLPALPVDAALRGRSFWLIGLAQFCFAFAASGTNLHAIPYFIGIGYGAARAALFMSLVLGIAGAGKLGMGLLADRIGARRALVLNFLLC